MPESDLNCKSLESDEAGNLIFRGTAETLMHHCLKQQKSLSLRLKNWYQLELLDPK